MKKYMIIANISEDVFDELCSYPDRRVDILDVQEIDVPNVAVNNVSFEPPRYIPRCSGRYTWGQS